MRLFPGRPERSNAIFSSTGFSSTGFSSTIFYSIVTRRSASSVLICEQASITKGRTLA